VWTKKKVVCVLWADLYRIYKTKFIGQHFDASSERILWVI